MEIQNNTKNEYSFLKNSFANPDSKYSPYIFIRISRDADENEIKSKIQDAKKSGAGTVIPILCFDDDDTISSGKISIDYGTMLKYAASEKIHVAINIQKDIEYLTAASIYDFSEIAAEELNCREYACMPKEKVKLEVFDGKIMSIVAFDDDYLSTVDLRDCVKNGRLEWQAPEGNWKIRQYVIQKPDNYGINYLNYQISADYLSDTYSELLETFKSHIGREITDIFYSDVSYATPNRRTWCSDFNEKFESEYGFDPAVYYPALFGFIGENTDKIKAMFMQCRAKILQDGYLKALSDFANKYGLGLLGHVSEPKSSSCSWIVGDAMRDNTYAAGASLDRSYMYGTNSLKIASGAADNFGLEIVGGELYDHFSYISRDIAFKEAMNAFSRGVNLIEEHLSEDPADSGNSENDQNAENTQGAVPAMRNFFFGKKDDYKKNLSDFIRRSQSLLRGGAHVSDIAMLYPIQSLHSDIYLYESPTNGFEYPDTPTYHDYMTLINSIIIYAGHDLTLIHPTTLDGHCRAENGKLIMDNDPETEYAVLFIPSMKMISLSNLRKIADFYDCGGKIVCTGELPRHEFGNTDPTEFDKPIMELVAHIFGNDAADKGIIRDYCHNANENGGEAYYLYSNKTAADGTDMVESALVCEALKTFDISYDVVAPIPRIECTGMLNLYYPEFVRMGLNSHMPIGGMFGYIHKKRSDCDIYYFSNTTKLDYNDKVLLKGMMTTELFDPYTGNIKKLDCEYQKQRGQIYTCVPLSLKSASAVFVVGRPVKNK